MIAAAIAALAVVLLLPLVAAGIRQRSLVTMAVRNIGRRRAEAALVVGGALLGTAIITSALVVGDVIEGSSADAARTQYGPVDITVTPPFGTPIEGAETAVAAAGITDIDGLLTTTESTGTIEAPARGTALPQVHVVELDLPDAQSFGASPAITGLADVTTLAPGEIVVNSRTADRLEVEAGDTLRLHAYEGQVDLTISAVVAEIGLAGYGGAIVAPGTLEGLAAHATGLAAPPREQLLVSLDGRVFDTRDLSDEVTAALAASVEQLPGVEVEATKALVLDGAARDGAGLGQMFAGLGTFSVLAGILLLVNLFVMLAEERKTELGMLRAVGFTRRRLIRAFAIEGAIYAVLAAAAGAVVGVGIGWLVAVVAGPILTDTDTSYALVVDPSTLSIGAATGLVISLVTIWVTSLRIARLNIIRAIRDLPEPPKGPSRFRTLVLGGIGILAGAAAGIAGAQGGNALLLVLGVPVAAFSATPLLRHLLPERLARLLVAGTVLVWALVVPLLPATSANDDMGVFVVLGVVLTAGAVSLASNLDRFWIFVVERLSRSGAGLAPRLGVAYPLARRFRTSMLLAMFSLVIFTVTILTAASSSMGNTTDETVEQMAAGFDVLLDTNPANPAEVDALASQPDVIAVAGLVQGMASFDADHLDASREWPLTGFDEGLLARGAPGLTSRPDAYASDEAVYRAVLADSTLAVVPETFLTIGVEVAELGLGDTFTVLEPLTGDPRELTIVGISQPDWLLNGALVGSEFTTALFGATHPVARTYLAVAPTADPDAVAAALNATFLPNGADARTFQELGSEGVKALVGFIAIMQSFLGLGLLVGIAGLGVVMIRAVHERRQEIGMLRAMGFRAGTVRAALLCEAGIISVQGTIIGAALGLVTARQMLTGSGDFAGGDFTVPWGTLALILATPLVASLAATAWPASRAAAIRPAIALRASD